MKGRDRFTASEAREIRSLLSRLRVAERNESKKLRARLRTIGFHIRDWDATGAGFTRAEFDELVQRGLLTIAPDAGDTLARSANNAAHDEPGRPSRNARIPESPVDQEPPGPAPRELVEAAIAALSGQRYQLAHAPVAVHDGPGLYAIYGEAHVWFDLGLSRPPDDRPLYVGKAEDSLVRRDLNTHFGKGQTGRSTVRRSMAALLRDTLGLRGMPRNPSKPERPANFGLSAEHEAALGEWMHSHLALATWPKPAECSRLIGVERLVIAHWQPPLNLKDNTSPWQPRLSQARRMMADDARQWARERRLSRSPWNFAGDGPVISGWRRV